jgi:hypothetical protein
MFVTTILVSAEDFNRVFLSPLDAATEPEFESICSGFSAHEYMQCNFEQIKTSVKTGRSIVSSGEITINKKKGMLIKTIFPAASSMFAGNDVVIMANSRGEKKLEAKGNEAFFAVSEIFKSIFFGNTSSLKQNYDIFFKKDGSSWLIGIKIKENTSLTFFTNIVLKGNRYIDTMLLYSQNGDVIKYSLSNIRFPGVLTESEMEYFSQYR